MVAKSSDKKYIAKSCGNFLIVSKIIEEEDSGGIVVVQEKKSTFSKGVIVSCGDSTSFCELDEIVFFSEDSIELGLGFPKNYVIIEDKHVVAKLYMEGVSHYEVESS